MKRYTFLVAMFALMLIVPFVMLNSSSANKKMFSKGSDQELALAKSISLNHLEGYGVSAKDLQVKYTVVDELSMAHTRVQQMFNGIPVFGGESIVHLNSDGSVFAVTDNLVQNIKVNTNPTITKENAMALGVSAYGCSSCLTAEPVVDMWVMRRGKKDHLIYRIQLRREDNTEQTSMPIYFIDAHSGKVVWHYDNLQTATGSGASLYSGNVSFVTYLKSGTYYLEDTGRKVGTFDSRNTTASVYRFTDTDNVWSASTQRAAVDAHIGAELVYDYYLGTHGRNGIDGNGGPGYYASADGVTGLISSKVHYSSRYNNAFWNGSFMTYGDGDGTNFTPLVTIDIAGHEITHGVTERTAGLIYSNESGALNESMSDVFGSMVERYAYGESANTWKIGEQAFTPSISGDALRYMDNPHLAGNSGFTADDDPDHYTERYTGTSDNGGVHTNSGICNKVFYMVAKGGTNHRSTIVVTGAGADAAAKIWYKALTTYMTSSTNFHGARVATLNAAAALYGTGSANYNTVVNAWTACGVN